MGDVIDPSRASIDGLIDWLREKRVHEPNARLTDLLSTHQFDGDRLVDLACIDLIQRRRMGHAVTVETYLDEFPTLAEESTRLDLIDAELCVASELGGRPDVEHYVERFPDLAKPIRELIRLERNTPAMMDSAVIHLSDASIDGKDLRHSNDDTTSKSAEFSLETTPQASVPRTDFASPVEVPDWFVGEKCIATSPGRWLFQGRDANRGTALALKVVELPTDLTAAEQEEILDACERAVHVRNAAWIKPSVAAIQSRRLAVIRPWLFVQPWEQASVRGQYESELRMLAGAAFTLQSAHDAGATHGGIHAENLMVDQTGKVLVVDAIASRQGISRWLRCRPTSDSADPLACQSRIDLDVQGLIKLIVSATVEWNQPWSVQLACAVRKIADEPGRDACARIGELLIRCADHDGSTHWSKSGGATEAGGWSARLRNWLGLESP